MQSATAGRGVSESRLHLVAEHRNGPRHQLQGLEGRGPIGVCASQQVEHSAFRWITAGRGGLKQARLIIVPLVRGDRVLVTFELADGFTDEVRAAVRSGLKTTFTYVVDLRLEVPAWVDRTIATAVIHRSSR